MQMWDVDVEDNVIILTGQDAVEFEKERKRIPTQKELDFMKEAHEYYLKTRPKRH